MYDNNSNEYQIGYGNQQDFLVNDRHNGMPSVFYADGHSASVPRKSIPASVSTSKFWWPNPATPVTD